MCGQGSKGSISMTSIPNYANFISLNENFKDVFNLEEDSNEESLWKRFILTNDFHKLISQIQFLFSEEQLNKRKAILLTGKYGVGKSHALAYLSHILWDEYNTIEDLLEKAKQEMQEEGATISLFRESKRYFPVILYNHDSSEVHDAKSFEYRLQVALERSLKKYGLEENISEKTTFEQYLIWIRVQEEKKEGKGISLIPILEDFIREKTTFSNVAELEEALEDRDSSAVAVIDKFFSDQDISSICYCDTQRYYENVLFELRKHDSSIAGIIIYWDEFTTVFNVAGRQNDPNLIKVIENWAEKASKGIYLFPVTHQTPEGLRGKYENIKDALAKINDRFEIVDFRMDKITALHIIAESITVKNNEQFDNFLIECGLDDSGIELLKDKYRKLFPDIYLVNDSLFKKIIPLDIHATYVASKVADLFGSVQRSIFQLLHSDDEIEYSYGVKKGFKKFLQTEPKDDSISWYTTDMIFDFFYSDISENEMELHSNPSALKAFNAFKQFYQIVHTKGEIHLKVFKTVVFLEMLETTDRSLTSSLSNIRLSLEQSKIGNVETILSELVDLRVLVPYPDDINGDIIYKTSFSGYDGEELYKIKAELKKAKKFNGFVEYVSFEIIDIIKKECSTSPRIKHGNTNIHVWEFNSIEEKIKKEGEPEDLKGLHIVATISENAHDIELSKGLVQNVSIKYPSVIFLHFTSDFERIYELYIDALAMETLGKKRSSRQMITEAETQQKTIKKKVREELTIVLPVVNGKETGKTSLSSINIQKYIGNIYPKGFDSKKYQLLWNNPKKESVEIFHNYGKPNGRKQIEESSNSVIKQILRVFKDEKEDYLIDEYLQFREGQNVENSGLYEVVTKIRSYIQQNKGKWMNLRDLIDNLKIEHSPFGLCVWTESLVLTYAFAEFYAQRRLEITVGHKTTTKDPTKIVSAINETIKKLKYNAEIRIGSSTENEVAKEIDKLFQLNSNLKDLSETIYLARDWINTSLELPLWLIPYSFYENQRNIQKPIFDSIDKYLKSYEKNGAFSEEDLKTVNQNFKSIELEFNKNDLLTKENAIEGLREYIHIMRPNINSTFSSLEELKKELKSEIGKDIWSWKETDLSKALASLDFNSRKPPLPPINLLSNLSGRDINLYWNMSADSPTPTSYVIERGEHSGEYSTSERVNANQTKYIDRDVVSRKTYYYRIIAHNNAGESAPSEEISQLVLSPPPGISIEAVVKEYGVELSWSSPEISYEITSFEIYRGEDQIQAIMIEQITDSETNYIDRNATEGMKYYYGIVAINKMGQKSNPQYVSVNLPHATPPSSPQNIQTTLQKEGILISWEFPESGRESVKEFVVNRKDITGTILRLAVLPSDSNLEYFDKTVAPDGLYQYRVSARNEAGESVYSETEGVRFPAKISPIELSSSEEEGFLKLAWTKGNENSNVQKYTLLKGEHPGKLEKLTELSKDEITFIDKDVKKCQSYYYGVRAQNILGEVRESNLILFSPVIQIDTHKWKNNTKAFARQDFSLFLNSLRETIEDLSFTDENSQRCLSIILQAFQRVDDE